MVEIFGLSEAEYYCKKYQGRGGMAARSFQELLYNYLAKNTTRLKEGKAEFDDYRDCSLRDVERRLFLSISHYRRSLDLLHTSAATWAHVTLYYASFFAASALLGMFGCYVGDRYVIEVIKSSPGHQELGFNWQTMGDLRIQKKGPHGKFWNIFYEVSPSLVPWVTDLKQKTALDPIQGNNEWQIETRNKVNYDTYMSVDLMTRFQPTFNPNQFPSCVKGELRTQMSTVDNITRLVFDFAKQFSLSTDALSTLTPAGSRRDKIQQLVLDPTWPNLSAKVDWDDFLR